jgi:hypothetical protein
MMTHNATQLGTQHLDEMSSGIGRKVKWKSKAKTKTQNTKDKQNKNEYQKENEGRWKCNQQKSRK